MTNDNDDNDVMVNIIAEVHELSSFMRKRADRGEPRPNKQDLLVVAVALCVVNGGDGHQKPEYPPSFTIGIMNWMVMSIIQHGLVSLL